MQSCISLFSIVLTTVCRCASESTQEQEQLDGKPANLYRGNFKREHSLVKPYQGSGMDIPNWDIVGSTMVSHQYIRLTGDMQSLKGGIWNRNRVTSSDWELIVSFKVHGSTGDLFGDGFAIWYVEQPNQIGPVFGAPDYFRGLGVFLDTYSNHNGEHKHSHPYISAMVNNGSSHYDHDMDGTHTQLGGHDVGCEAKFRNKDYVTQILVRYVGDVLSIYTDISGKGEWKQCMNVGGVFLPSGYYFGVSAATGELSDNHDLISIKMFEQEYVRMEGPGDVDRRSIEPRAQFYAAPRDHIDDPRPSKLGWFGTFILMIVAIAVIVVALGFGIIFIQKSQERSRKRFY